MKAKTGNLSTADGSQALRGVGLLAEELRKKALLLTHAIHGATEQSKEYCKPELDLWEEMLPVYELALDVVQQAKQLEAAIGRGRG